MGDWIISILGTGTAAAVFVELLRWGKAAFDKRKSRGFYKLKENIDTIGENVEHIQKEVGEIKNDLQDREFTDSVLLHDRIYAMFDRLKDAETISVSDKANLDYLFAEYEKLGGNHAGRIMYETLKDKPVEG